MNEIKEVARLIKNGQTFDIGCKTKSIYQRTEEVADVYHLDTTNKKAVRKGTYKDCQIFLTKADFNQILDCLEIFGWRVINKFGWEN